MTIPRSKYHANLHPLAHYLTRLYLDRARLSRALFDALLFESRAKRTPKATVAIGYAFDQLVKVG